MKTLAGAFASADAARTAFDDLIAAGIARENVHLDPDAMLVKVVMPAEAEGAVRELLDGHDPVEVTEASA